MRDVVANLLEKTDGASRSFLGLSREPFREYSDTPRADELHHTTTEDGIDLGLWRYRPRSVQPVDDHPVLFVHGLGSNNRTLALDDRYGLAQYLAKRGYDCWAVDLRGRGASGVPEEGWTFDAYAKYDLPAAIDYVLEKTSRDQLHWVGHSMGGMLFFALAGSLDYDDRLASGTTLASPIDFPEPRFVERIGSVLHGLPFATHLKTNAPAIRFLLGLLRMAPEPVTQFLYNPPNVERETLLKAASLAFAGTSSKVVTQFPSWFVNDNWMDGDRRVDYRAGVPSVTVPTQVIAGSVDRLSPPEHVKSGYDDLGASEKRFIIAGEISGYRENYSHIDLIYGKRAPDEIFPLVSDWIRRHPLPEGD